MSYPKIIAVDFDGCLCVKKWPEIGAANRDAINALIRHQAEGGKVILWTCREGQMLEDAVLWCINRGLKFDAINDNLESSKEYFKGNSRKVYAHEYWDDRAIPVAAGACCAPGIVTVFHKNIFRRLFGKMKGTFTRWNGKQNL